MEEKRYQEMVFSVEDYKYDGAKARENMYNDIGKFLAILMKSGYIAVVREDETDIVVIEYEHNERFEYWGIANPAWITEEEKDRI